MAKYTYFLEEGTTIQFYPDRDAVYVWKDDSDTMGFMRKNIKDLVITKDYDDGSGVPPNANIFNTLWQYYFDSTKQTTEIKVLIYKDSVLDYTGLFYIKDCNIDVNNGVCMITPTVDDRYREFMLLADNEVNIINGEGTFSIYELYSADLESFDNGQTIVAPTNAADSSPLPDVWVLNGTVWSRKVSPYYEGTYSPTEYEGFYYYPTTNNLVAPFPFPNCYLLTDSISLILSTMGSGLTFKSVFFNVPFVDGQANYVTGETNLLNQTLIAQNSDVKDPGDTDKATVGVISFNNLMGDLKSMFNVRWYIDDDGFLRIEHLLWFENGLGISPSKTTKIDLTDEAKYTDAGSQKLYIEDTQDYVNAGTEPSKSETIQFANGAKSYDFRDDLNYISYDVIKSVVNVKKHVVSRFSTDIAKARNFPNEISDDGFHIFNCEYLGNISKAMIRKPHNYDGVKTIANVGFSPKWLLHDYYEYGRQDSSGVLNTSGTIDPTEQYAVLSTVPIYLQKDIVFLLNNADNIDINKYIATYLIKSDEVKYVVNGSIIEIEHDLETDFVTATLGYEL